MEKNKRLREALVSVQDDLDTRFGNEDRKKNKKAGKKNKKDEKDDNPKPEKKLTFVPYSRYKNGACQN